MSDQQQRPFKTVVQAVVHAFNDERYGANRPTMSRLADKYLGEPPSFSGEDGGAEKARALELLTKGLKPLHLAALRARYAPDTRKCPCCESKVPRLDWLAAVREVADAVGREEDATSVKPEVRLALVRRHFEGGEVKLHGIANDLGVSISTVSKANAIIMPFIRGAKRPKKAKDAKEEEAPLIGIEQAAMAYAEEILRAGGFVP